MRPQLAQLRQQNTTLQQERAQSASARALVEKEKEALSKDRAALDKEKSQLADEFNCCICQGAMVWACALSCGHASFCEECLYVWLDTNDTCPEVRADWVFGDWELVTGDWFIKSCLFDWL